MDKKILVVDDPQPELLDKLVITKNYLTGMLYDAKTYCDPKHHNKKPSNISKNRAKNKAARKARKQNK